MNLPRQRSRWLAVLVILSMVAVIGCSPENRYKVLSFFFDGVPAPPGMRAESPGVDMSDPELSDFRRAMEQLPKPEIDRPPPILSVHEPVANRECRACHGAPGANFETLPRDERLCDQCHREDRVNGGWDHGPINLGTCIPCHVPHESIYPNLLAKPVPDVCLYCHKEVMEDPVDYHQVDNFSNCTECHNPHDMY